MSALFATHPEVTKHVCDSYAEQTTGGSVEALAWQGQHSYTVTTGDERTIIQFRSEASPLPLDLTVLAKRVHGAIAPTTELLGYMPNSPVSVWRMEKLPGVGMMYILRDEDIAEKVDAAVTGMARFYAATWRPPQAADEHTRAAAHQEYKMKLTQLSDTLPSRLQRFVQHAGAVLDELMQSLPWVLTHGDLYHMNLLVDQKTGQLQGVVDWAEASIRPFGIALWGLESVLGYSNSDGWHWLTEKVACHRASFCNTFAAEVGGLSARQRELVEGARILGILMIYGFVWRDGAAAPTDKPHLLDVLLKDSLFV